MCSATLRSAGVRRSFLPKRDIELVGADRSVSESQRTPNDAQHIECATARAAVSVFLTRIYEVSKEHLPILHVHYLFILESRPSGYRSSICLAVRCGSCRLVCR